MKKFLDGPVDQVTEGVTQAIAADAFTFAEYDESAGEKVAWSDYSYWGSTFRMFFKNRVAVTLLVLLAAILLFTIVQPHLPGQRPATLINNDPDTGMMLMNVAPGRNSGLAPTPSARTCGAWSGAAPAPPSLSASPWPAPRSSWASPWGCCGDMSGSWTTC